MAADYKEYSFVVKPHYPGVEILIAELAELGFDSFSETEDGLLAYIPSTKDEDRLLNGLPLLASPDFELSYRVKEIPDQNWNEQWEQNFQPIEVDGKCRIRAPFHTHEEVEFDIVIQPKMAFGTGHHATTHLMLSYLLKEPLVGKKILDMGCGTGVLAILASLKGAGPIDAIDIDPWSYQNALENIALNQVERITVYEGDSRLLANRHYDCIVANINRNILLADMERYAQALNQGGILFLSGFYREDLKLIQQELTKNGLVFKEAQEREKWVAVKAIKE